MKEFKNGDKVINDEWLEMVVIGKCNVNPDSYICAQGQDYYSMKSARCD